MAVDTVRAQINGVWFTLTYNSTSGKYEATISAPSTTSYNINAGHYYPVTIEATDTAGNVATKNDTDATLGASLKLTVKEVNKPTITFTAPGSGAYLSNNTPSITFQLRDEYQGSGIKISTLQIKVDGGAALTNTSPGVTLTAAGNGYDVTYVPQSALGDGSHTVTIDIQDFDGNSAVQASRSFKVDTVPPTLSVTSPASSSSITNQAALNVVGVTNDSTSSPVSITIQLNGVSQGAISVDGSGNFSKSVQLASGANTIVVTATDLAGKTTIVTRTVTLDQIAPTISAITITPNPVNASGSYTISVTVSDT